MLTIVFVNYNSVELIGNCLGSIKDLSSFEIIIIDNSNDDPSNLLAKYPSIQWVPMGYNAGFSRANNKGIELAKGDTVLLLNPDVLAIDNSISRCYHRFIQSPYVACGIQLLNADKTHQISGSYFMRGGLNHFLPLPFLGELFKWVGQQLNIRKPSIEKPAEFMEVDWVNGAFLMVKKEVLKLSGVLDEDFFLYAEEIEWCSRLRKIGKICLYGDLQMIHLQGETANEAFNSDGKGYYGLFDRKGRQLMISNFLRIRKQFGKTWFIIHLLVYSLAIPVFLMAMAVQKLISSRSAYSLDQWKGFARNVACVWKHFGKLFSNKPYFYKVI